MKLRNDKVRHKLFGHSHQTGSWAPMSCPKSFGTDIEGKLGIYVPLQKAHAEVLIELIVCVLECSIHVLEGPRRPSP